MVTFIPLKKNFNLNRSLSRREEEGGEKKLPRQENENNFFVNAVERYISYASKNDLNSSRVGYTTSTGSRLLHCLVRLIFEK